MITKILIICIIMALIYHPEGEEVQESEDNHNKIKLLGKNLCNRIVLIASDSYLISLSKHLKYIKLSEAL